MDRQLTHARDAGVSLIELVVVVAVLAVFAVGISLVPAGSGGGGADKDAARFQARMAALSDRAVQGRAVLGLRITARDMQPVERGTGGWRDIGPAELWGGPVTVQVTRGLGDAPDILLLPNGRASAFAITFGRRTCRGAGWGPPQCDP
ncbi:prepilin-type N-terminal cleavage/methylation domain-containing protein [uncultured Tateyamaria sp.]|uniref:prepilin-type N-terminal cleavage/methylation domain-containing protein n=1 Tax=Tateyamaria sp. 1078 TaxID=3417464 RepID=UPI0026345E9E|nr:prepilin-type N-terminal cleavage/methylation domain-containing protein [uncultured Tateyamaria sp.]